MDARAPAKWPCEKFRTSGRHGRQSRITDVALFTRGALRAEEDHPGLKVFGEFFESMWDTGRGKQEVTPPKGDPFFTSLEHTAPSGDYVHLILFMRLLAIAVRIGGAA